VVDILWPDIEPEAAANNLPQIPHTIRSISGGDELAESRACGVPHSWGHRSLGWLHFLRSHVLRRLGDVDGSMEAAAAAQTMCTRLGEQGGSIAVQRICKGGLPTLSA
jgi:hypothetical protein